MIASNSLAAFAQGLGQTSGLGQTQGPAAPRPVPVRAPAESGGGTSTAPTQRTLEAVPPQPARPLPRGSLLDLRV